MIKNTLVIMLTAFSLNVSAGEKIQCNDSGNQLELNACAADELVAADQALNATYQAIIDKESADKDFVEKLKVAQRAWLAYRDAELAATFACEHNDPHVCWGSMLPMCYSSFKAKLTRERTNRLKEILTKGRPADGCH